MVLKNKSNPKFKCEWCGCGCNIINEHHYPIPKSMGGTKIVRICPNCHSELDRDVNAAINILNEGLRILNAM